MRSVLTSGASNAQPLCFASSAEREVGFDLSYAIVHRKSRIVPSLHVWASTHARKRCTQHQPSINFRLRASKPQRDAWEAGVQAAA